MPSYLVLAFLLGIWALLLIRAWRRHRWFAKEGDVFRCRIRLLTGWVPGLRNEWRGRAGWGRWVHDVLIFRAAGLRGRTYYLLVHTVDGPVSTAVAGSVGRLGSCPVTTQLRLDRGDVIEVAGPASARDLIAGPFIVASVLGDRDTAERRPPH
jgi:hypothetical protein